MQDTDDFVKSSRKKKIKNKDKSKVFDKANREAHVKLKLLYQVLEKEEAEREIQDWK